MHAATSSELQPPQRSRDPTCMRRPGWRCRPRGGWRRHLAAAGAAAPSGPADRPHCRRFAPGSHENGRQSLQPQLPVSLPPPRAHDACGVLPAARRARRLPHTAMQQPQPAGGGAPAAPHGSGPSGLPAAAGAAAAAAPTTAAAAGGADQPSEPGGAVGTGGRPAGGGRRCRAVRRPARLQLLRQPGPLPHHRAGCGQAAVEAVPQWRWGAAAGCGGACALRWGVCALHGLRCTLQPLCRRVDPCPGSGT